MPASGDTITVRYESRPGDLGAVVAMHGIIYAREYGFDATFEAYVAAPMAEFVKSRGERDRLWIAERGEQIVGSVAIVAASASEARLRWFLVDPSARGTGLGRRLLNDAIAFSREHGFEKIELWTVSALESAARLYRGAGFTKVEDKPGRLWGVSVVEERYELLL